MKKKNKLLITISLSIIVLLIAFYFSAKERVEVRKVSINYKENPCHVDFILVNNHNYGVLCKVSIRDFRRTPGRFAPAVIEPGFSGDKILNIELSPKERKEVKETLKLSGGTSRVKVHAFNVEKLQ